MLGLIRLGLHMGLPFSAFGWIAVLHFSRDPLNPSRRWLENIQPELLCRLFLSGTSCPYLNQQGFALTMQFGKAVGTACTSFLITNIDDLFVLVTFFAEASTSQTLTSLKITLGQYVGFTVIIVISMIGFGVSLALPSEPIGFLGLLPLVLGIWKLLGLLFAKNDTNDGEAETSKIAGMKSVLKVSGITIMNGGDNIGTYIPLFSQTKGAEIAIYVVIYYILLGALCFVASLVMKQKRILRLAETYMQWLIPFLYVGLGVYIVAKSSCYPWSIEHIDHQFLGNPGRLIMAVTTTLLLLSCIGIMLWIKVRRKVPQVTVEDNISLAENPGPARAAEIDRPQSPTIQSTAKDDADIITAADDPSSTGIPHELDTRLDSDDKPSVVKQSLPISQLTISDSPKSQSTTPR